MTDIVITEFMDEPAVDSLRAGFDVHYDPDLHGDAAARRAFSGRPGR